MTIPPASASPMICRTRKIIAGLAVSATLLLGKRYPMTFAKENVAKDDPLWDEIKIFRNQKPVAAIGYSIFIFDQGERKTMSENRPAKLRLGLVARSSAPPPRPDLPPRPRAPSALSRGHQRPALFTAPIVDQASYDRWAAAIAASGDWLGQDPFYQDPLYPYFLAVIYKIFGRQLVLVYASSRVFSPRPRSFCFTGSAIRSFKDPRVGLLAALLVWALFHPDRFYQAQLDKTGLGTSLVILALLAHPPGPRPAPPLLRFPAGLAWAALFLYRGNFFLVGPPVIAWLAFTLYQRMGKSALAPLLVFIGSLCAVLFLTALRNFAVSGELILTTSQAGENFYLGNFQGNPGARGWTRRASAASPRSSKPIREGGPPPHRPKTPRRRAQPLLVPAGTPRNCGRPRRRRPPTRTKSPPHRQPPRALRHARLRILSRALLADVAGPAGGILVGLRRWAFPDWSWPWSDGRGGLLILYSFPMPRPCSSFTCSAAIGCRSRRPSWFWPLTP